MKLKSKSATAHSAPKHFAETASGSITNSLQRIHPHITGAKELVHTEIPRQTQAVLTGM